MKTYKKILCIQLGRRGGGPHFALDIAKELEKEPEIQTIICFSSHSHFVDEFRKLHCRKYEVTDTGASVGAIRSFRALAREMVRNENPDEIWCCMGHPLDAFAVGIMKSRGAKYKIIVHDGLPHLGDPYLWLRPFSLWQELNATCLITLSAHVTSLVRARWPKKEVVQLWHPPFSITQRSSYNDDTLEHRECIKLLFFGRIIAYKGLDLLLEACLKLKAKSVPFELTIVGEGNISKKSLLVIEVLSARLINYFVEEKDVARYFEECDVVILPYIESSQSGVVATASSFERPVVCTPVGGLEEQVKSQNAGFVINEISSEILADKIEQLFINPDMLNQARDVLKGNKKDDLTWRAWVHRLLAQEP